MTLQRDVFIQVIFEEAKNDKDIVFLSADFGAEALDAFREELPDQFMHCGISEQHMIDMAAGLALSGKRVFCYCMGPFWLRCYEQIKCSLALMNLPVTLIGAGVGLGYMDSGPTHYVTEDIACMRALNGIEVLTPADTVTAIAIARFSLNIPRLRYIRLDREALPDTYDPEDVDFLKGMHQYFHETVSGKVVCILSSGYMLRRALAARNVLSEENIFIGVIDLYRIKPINPELVKVLQQYDSIITVEEQYLAGGFGSTVLEFLSDNNMTMPVHRMGLPDRYVFENGGRAHLLDMAGLSVKDICRSVMKSS